MLKMKDVLIKSEKEYTKWYAKPFLVFLVCIVLLVLPLILRNYLVFGEEFYLYKRVAVDKFDSLSYGGRDNLYNKGNTFVFTYIDNYFFSIILGFFSLLLFYGILKRFDVNSNLRIISCFLLTISPPFLYLFSTFRGLTIPVFLSLLGIYFLMDRKFYWVSYFIFPLIGFFGLLPSIVLLILLLIYSLRFKRFGNFLIIFVLTFIVLLFLYIPLFKDYGFPEKPDFVVNNFQDLIFDLGGIYGVSIFILLLMFFGLSNLWEKKYKNLSLYILFLIFIILLFFSFKVVIYFNFLLAFLGALGINWIIKREWGSNLVKVLSLILIISGLLFSSFSFIINEVNAQPTQDLVKSLIFLKSNSNKDDVILSHYKYGIFINSISERKNVMDSYFLYAPDLNKRYEDINFLFETRDLEKALSILNKYNVTYILITDKMRSGLVWNKEEEGFLFLLHNNPKVFNQIYDNNIEIWEIK